VVALIFMRGWAGILAYLLDGRPAAAKPSRAAERCRGAAHKKDWREEQEEMT